jgi:hypothetical protein
MQLFGLPRKSVALPPSLHRAQGHRWSVAELAGMASALCPGINNNFQWVPSLDSAPTPCCQRLCASTRTRSLSAAGKVQVLTACTVLDKDNQDADTTTGPPLKVPVLEPRPLMPLWPVGVPLPGLADCPAARQATFTSALPASIATVTCAAGAECTCHAVAHTAL